MAAKYLDAAHPEDPSQYADIGQWSDMWVSPLVKLCLTLRISADLVWLAAGFLTLVSGFFFLCLDFVFGFFFLFLQIYLEQVGYHLAQKTTPTLMGEYFNEIIDFVGLFFLVCCIVNTGFESFRLFGILCVWPTLIFQNTYRRFYLYEYLKKNHKTVRNLTRPLPKEAEPLKLLSYLRPIYVFFHSLTWKPISRFDAWIRGDRTPEGWYEDKLLLKRQSWLRRGSHFLLLAALTFITDLGIAIVGFLIIANGYWIALIGMRISKYRDKAPVSPSTQAE